MTITDPRKAALGRVQELMAIVTQQPASQAQAQLLEECEALGRAIDAFHMEGIRFRAYNVDRLLHQGGIPLPAEADEAFKQMRQDLEAAGFHTRSHQAPV